ncbi:hypothetical protein [Taibaiella soli]|uniref:Uncharacterized protein n=1 Tax=Taibaiella soli TaxID=1649169 RepID=A0A2W2AK87_9BACT|nr:hypothetical protein [Taibaiella soli]PZF72670.1 hypothetical protein DN068_12455 [Taibaiella soli]
MLSKYILSIALLFFIPFTLRAQVAFVSEQDGVITLRTQGTATKKGDLISDAQKNAFFYLFYRGIPGASADYKNPLIGTNETQIEQEYATYFKDFYQYRYQSFIVVTDNASDLIKGKHKQKTVYTDVSININALRKDLEANNIIRKFGF